MIIRYQHRRTVQAGESILLMGSWLSQPVGGTEINTYSEFLTVNLRYASRSEKQPLPDIKIIPVDGTTATLILDQR